jgi:hypothetical protein
MSFWTSERDVLEPKRKNRWILVINDINSYTCKKTAKPQYEQGEAEHNYLGHTYYFPGTIKWKELSITVVDPVDNPVTKKLAEIVERSGYHPLSGVNDYGFISKKKAVRELGLVKVMQLDADGNPIETWTLHNGWLKDINFGELDYTQDDLVEVEFSIRFDWATLENEDGTRNFDLGGSNPADTTFTV